MVPCWPPVHGCGAADPLAGRAGRAPGRDAGALVLFGGCLLAYWAQPDAVFGLQGWLWLTSMILLVAACARGIPAPAPLPNPVPPGAGARWPCSWGW